MAVATHYSTRVNWSYYKANTLSFLSQIGISSLQHGFNSGVTSRSVKKSLSSKVPNGRKNYKNIFSWNFLNFRVRYIQFGNDWKKQWHNSTKINFDLMKNSKICKAQWNAQLYTVRQINIHIVNKRFVYINNLCTLNII